MPFPLLHRLLGLSPRSPQARGPRFPRRRLFLEPLEDRLAPAVHEWSGLGADNLWSNNANWIGGAPTIANDPSGDIDLVFHTNLANPAQLVTQNDIVGLVVDSITFDANPGTGGIGATGGTSTAGYTINGNTITINTGAAGQDPFGIDVANNVTASTITETFNAGITLATTDATFRSQQSGARLTFAGALDLGGQTLTIDNTTGGGNSAVTQGVVISGNVSNGNLIKNNDGTLQLTGNNSYADTTVNGGFVLADSSTALGAAAGTVTVTGQTALSAGQIQLRNGVTVQKTTLNLDSNAIGGGVGADGNTTNTWRSAVVLNSTAGATQQSSIGAGTGANTSTRLIIDGVISDAGGTQTLFIHGSGVVEFTQDNSYTGQTNLNATSGSTALQIDSPAGLGAGFTGNETIIARNGAGPTGSALWLNFTGQLRSTGNLRENILFAGSGVDGLGAIRVLGNNLVTVPGDITFNPGAPWVFGVDSATATMSLSGTIDSLGATRALTKVGPGTLVISTNGNNTFVGNTIINAGVLSVMSNALQPLGNPATNTVQINNTGTLRVEVLTFVPNPVQINAGGTLAGSGVVTGAVTSTGGTISPGASPGLLTVGNTVLDAASVFRVELNGVTAGTLFDQLNVNGTVNLGNARLDVLPGFMPTPGTTFRILDKVSAGAITGTFNGLPEGARFAIAGTTYAVSYIGGDGNDVVLTATAPVATHQARFAVGAGAGAPGIVQVYDGNGALVFQLNPYPGFLGGVVVATGDITGDGVDDIITGTATASAHVKAFDGVTGTEIRSFFAYVNFNGGVYVAAGDVNGDGRADIITGAGPGAGPHVKVFDGVTNAEIRSFFAYAPNYTGGVTVGAGDINGDNRIDIITGTAFGSSHVKVFDGISNAEIRSFFAYPGFIGGVYVAGGDVNGDGRDDIITGTGKGGGSHVKVFSGLFGAELFSFFAYGPGYNGGVTVGSTDLNGDGRDDILTGTFSGSAHVEAFSGLDVSVLMSFFAQRGTAGVYVG